MVAVSAFGLNCAHEKIFPVFLLINKRKQCMSRRGGLVLVSVKRSAPHGSMVAPLLSAIEPTHIVPTPTSLLSTRHLHHLSSQNIVFLFLHSTLNKGPAIICNWQRRDKTEPDNLFSFRQSDNRQSEQSSEVFCQTQTSIRIWPPPQDLCSVICSNGRLHLSDAFLTRCPSARHSHVSVTQAQASSKTE